MSWFNKLIDGFEDAQEYVFDQTAYQQRRVLQEAAKLASALHGIGSKNWTCRKCRHPNAAQSNFCGGCGRKKGSPITE